MDSVLAQEDFDKARFKAFRRAIGSALTGRRRRLVPLEQVLEAARLDGQAYGGVREIPLDRVVGSAFPGRGRDFDPSFLPISDRLRHRWAALYEAMLNGAPIPPIEVYELDGSYYVVDGHHRVSVARNLGWDTMPARVTEVRTRAPLAPDADPAELLRAAEYAQFLEATRLDRLRPDARLEVSRLGRYDEILKHILGHRYFLGLERGQEVSMDEAVASWYDTVYLPIAKLIRRHDVLKQLPGWTEADLYVEVTRRWLEQGKAGQEAGPRQAMHDLLDQETRRWWRQRRLPLHL
ncbi:MAG: hypothetical protein E6I70_01680 [Chloroflexi bacterium]|nr:MAG: hypothetical protein E6I63_14260 [Chloroflexota bacterium]TME20299.1 MAG: hypothetical protein E6I70_01680 [Chloroflexota bacterium]